MNNPNQLLHYQFTPSSSPNTLPTIVFIHGLFGDLNNLGVIARAFVENYPILRLDLRNHGQSFQSEIMDYPLMAQDVLRLLDELQLEQIIVVGHSMGGKVAMQLASLQPNRIKRLIVIDMAPISYPNNGHNDVFAGLFAVKNASVTTRQQAKPLLAEHIHSESVQQFMLKSFDANSPERFRFHLSALWQNYPNLMAWQPIQYNQPTLFIKGGLSDYIQAKDQQTIIQQFPQARAFTINGAGHWVHAEKPDLVIRAIERFLAK